MSEDQALALVATAGALVLVLSSMRLRRLPTRKALLMGAAWIVIFALGALVARMAM